MPFLAREEGCSLYYRDWGSGRPVVLLHGWGLGGGMWEYQMPWLVEQGLRSIALDARGCGRSDDPGSGYDFDTLADDLAALFDELELREATIVAHSMSGGTVARYLAKHGAARVARVLLLAPTTPFVLKTEDNPDGVDAAMFDFMRSQLRADRPGFLAAGAAGFFGDGVSSQIVDWGYGLAMSASPRAVLEYTHTFSETDLRGDLAAFTVPTLVIQGDRDQSTPLELTGRRTAEGIAGAKLVIYENAAHGLFYTERERLNRDLLAFIDG